MTRARRSARIAESLAWKGRPPRRTGYPTTGARLAAMVRVQGGAYAAAPSPPAEGEQ